MLINLSTHRFDDLSQKVKQKIIEKYGSVLEINLPVIVADNKIPEIANKYFRQIAASFDSCANEPKENAVCMSIQTHLEKKLMSILIASEINVVLSCW
jgi:hypothetical protein